MTIADGENALSKRGAATMIGRSGNTLQILVVCDTEDEAKAILERLLTDIRERGQTTMVICGTVDEAATAGMRS